MGFILEHIVKGGKCLLSRCVCIDVNLKGISKY